MSIISYFSPNSYPSASTVTPAFNGASAALLTAVKEKNSRQGFEPVLAVIKTCFWLKVVFHIGDETGCSYFLRMIASCTAGPFRQWPIPSKRDPWQGHSHSRVDGLNFILHPMCGQRGAWARNDPLA